MFIRRLQPLDHFPALAMIIPRSDASVAFPPAPQPLPPPSTLYSGWRKSASISAILASKPHHRDHRHDRHRRHHRLQRASITGSTALEPRERTVLEPRTERNPGRWTAYLPGFQFSSCRWPECTCARRYRSDCFSTVNLGNTPPRVHLGKSGLFFLRSSLSRRKVERSLDRLCGSAVVRQCMVWICTFGRMD